MAYRLCDRVSAVIGCGLSPPSPGPPMSESLGSACGSWLHHSPVSAEASWNQADGEGFPPGFAICDVARSPLVRPQYCGGVAIVSPCDTHRPTSPISPSPRAVPSRERLALNLTQRHLQKYLQVVSMCSCSAWCMIARRVYKPNICRLLMLHCL